MHLIVADQTELGLGVRGRLQARMRPREAAPPYRSSPFGRRVHGELQSRQIRSLVVAHLETAAAIADVLAAPHLRSVLDLHNLYSPYFRIRGKSRVEASWAATEAKACAAATAITVLSAQDQELVRRHNRRVVIVPNGVAMEEWPPIDHERSGMGLAYFGTWTHMPNQTGLRWFLDNAWPTVCRARPEAFLHLYGPGAPDTGGAERVQIHGRVTDLHAALSLHQGIIVPIVEGVGARVKFVEALATGVPVISTSLGAQGYDVPEAVFARADSPDDFAAACLHVLEAGDSSRMAVAAREFVSAHYTWDKVCQPLCSVVGNL